MSNAQERLHRLIDEHADRVDRYRRGELPAEEFRPIRLSYGLYAQLEQTSHLQRIKVPGGLLDSAQLRTIAGVADRWGRGLLHVTTRQDFQIHWVPLEAVREMYHRLQEVGISTRGACSDSVRNVTASPCAGTCTEEPFDVLPYALALESYFLFHPLNLTLPRKFKPAFSGCPHDEAQGIINDLAFYAHRRDGEDGFAVYVGGGLGASPHLAKPLVDFAPAADVLAIAEAVVRVQHRFGERRNRHKARLKFLLQRMGLERFRATVRLELDALLEERGVELRRELRDALARYRLAAPRRSTRGREPERADPSYALWRRTNVRAQSQRAFFAVAVVLPLGDITAAQLGAVADLAEIYGNGTIRTTNDQNLILPFVAAEDLGVVHDTLATIQLSEANALRLSDVTSCPGADYCSLAVTRSMQVAQRIRTSLLTSALDVEGLGRLRIKISGCPNSCGQHHVADFGLTGMMVKDASGLEQPHCAILVGGSVGEAEAVVGRRLRGKFPEPVVPRVIEALTGFYARERRGEETFRAFVARVGLDPLQRLADAELQPPEESVSVGAA